MDSIKGKKELNGDKMNNKRILISGAGIAGLTLAYWLKQYGFTPTLVEKYPTLRTGGQKIDIRGVAIEVIRRMEAYHSIFEARTDIQGVTIVDSAGKPLTHLEFALTGHREEEDLEIMRGDLCKILFDRIGNVECLFGNSISRITQNEEGILRLQQGKVPVLRLWVPMYLPAS